MTAPHQALARLAFDAYNTAGPNPYKTFDGRDVPLWEGLNDEVRGKWTAAARAIADALAPTAAPPPSAGPATTATP